MICLNFWFLGDIFLSFERYLPPNFQSILNEITENKKEASFFQTYSRHNEVSAIKFSLTNVEIFLCEISDLIIYKSFNKVKKRNLLLPFSFHFGRKWYIILSKRMDKLVETTKNDINIEKVIITSSLNDNVLMWDTIKFQIDLYRKHLEETKRVGQSVTGNAVKAALETLETMSPGILLKDEIVEEKKVDNSATSVMNSISSIDSVHNNHLLASPVKSNLINIDQSANINKLSNIDQNSSSNIPLINTKKEPESSNDIEDDIKEELIFQSNGIQFVIIISLH